MPLTPSLRCRVCYAYDTDIHDVGEVGEEILCCNYCGASSVIAPKTRVSYDRVYVASRYDVYSTTPAMSRLRRNVIEGVLGLHESIPESARLGMGTMPLIKGRVLDVGYGNGSFIREMREHGWDAYGNDVNPTEYEGVRQVPLPANGDLLQWRAITFFDSLEHFESLEVIRKVGAYTGWIFVSCPACPIWFPASQDRNVTWKHYLPGEHHHYFHSASLVRLFSSKDVEARLAYLDYPEDSIRGTLPDGSPNIMTVGIKCKRREPDA